MKPSAAGRLPGHRSEGARKAPRQPCRPAPPEQRRAPPASHLLKAEMGRSAVTAPPEALASRAQTTSKSSRVSF